MYNMEKTFNTLPFCLINNTSGFFALRQQQQISKYYSALIVIAIKIPAMHLHL